MLLVCHWMKVLQFWLKQSLHERLFQRINKKLFEMLGETMVVQLQTTILKTQRKLLMVLILVVLIIRISFQGEGCCSISGYNKLKLRTLPIIHCMRNTAGTVGRG